MTAATSKSGSDSEKNSKKEKCSPPTKIVIRRLPPSMTKEEFEDQVSPISDNNYLRFVKADPTLDRDAFCTAYINFIDQEDVYIFQERFDGYVFVDNKGNEYISIVEFAPNQKIPIPKEQKRRDAKINTIEQDPDYLKYIEMLESKPESTGLSVEQTLEEIEHRERESRAGRGLEHQITPLLQFFKDKKEEKMKKREELKEQRRKKEEEKRKTREDERLKRKENKEREIKEREKRDKKEVEKKNEKPEEDIKTRQLEKKKEKQGDSKTFELKEGESGVGGGEAEKKSRREREKEKRIQREEREKERFRKREEERRKRKEEEKEKKKFREKENTDTNDQTTKEDNEDKLKNHQNKKLSESKGNDESKDESKTKKYSDRRKEDKQRRDKEKSEKKKKEEEIITIDDDTSRDDILEDLSEAAQSLGLNEPGEPAEIVKKEKRKSYRERREEKKIQHATGAVEGIDKHDKRDSDKEKKDRKYKKPDIQIYRPGMGRFTSKKNQEKRDDEAKSPKTSPDESRDSSPNKKLSTKSSRNPSPEEKKGRSNRMLQTEEYHHEEEKLYGFSHKKGKVEEQLTLTTPTNGKKETLEEHISEQSAPVAPVPRSKGYRANRIAKTKKKVEEGSQERVEFITEKLNHRNDHEKPEERKQNNPLDETKIAPLTSAPHVITLDNDKID